jgi:hypothetical protein
MPLVVVASQVWLVATGKTQKTPCFPVAQRLLLRWIMSRHVIAGALVVLSTTNAYAENKPVVDRTTGLVSGIGLIVLGAGAAAGAGFYALGRLPYDELEEDHGPGGGTLAAIGTIGSVGLIIGVTLTVLASTPPKEAARKPPAPRAQLTLGPQGIRAQF